MGDVRVVGHVKTTKWFVLNDGDVISFHTAVREDGSKVTFMSDCFTWPAVVAQQYDLEYEFLRNSSDEEIEEFLFDHPDLVVAQILEV